MTMLIGYFLLVIVSTQPWPIMFGPYTHSECLDTLDYLKRLDYEVSSCEVLPLPQPDAVYRRIPFVP